MSDSQIQKIERVNELDINAIAALAKEMENDPQKGVVGYRVHTAWKGQTLSETTVDSYTLGKRRIPRSFTIAVDEPFELFGTDTAPNPQETLMAGLNGCMTVAYMAFAALKGITLELLEIETSSELDLRGFFGIDPKVRPGFEAIKYTVHIKGNGSEEQFHEIHETVMRSSPNFFNLSQPIRLDATLLIEKD